MNKYLYFVFFGIIIYCIINTKDKFLVDFIPSQMNKCKSQQCTTQGDCQLQCYATLFYEDPDYYDRTQTRYAIEDSEHDKMRRIINYINSQLGKNGEDQTFPEDPNPYRYLSRLSDEEYNNTSTNTINMLTNIFSRIPSNKARLVYFIKKRKGQPYTESLHHYIIFGNYNNDLYILDPKHRVIFKNKDILHNPWLDIEFRDYDIVESFDWSRINYGDDLIYFYPIVNTDQTDNIVIHDEVAVRNKLLNDDSNLTREMSTAYRNWYRKESDQLLHPGEDAPRVCAANTTNTEDTSYCNIM